VDEQVNAPLRAVSAAEVLLPRRVRVAAVLRSSVHSPVEASRMTEPSFYWLAGLAKNSVSEARCMNLLGVTCVACCVSRATTGSQLQPSIWVSTGVNKDRPVIAGAATSLHPCARHVGALRSRSR